MKKLEGKVAVVTGAASGIGRELAVGLAGEGCRLALSDVNLRGLEETAGMIASRGGQALIGRVSVADRKEMFDFAEQVISNYGAIDIVINNAGIVYTSTIEDLSYEDFERVMNINFWGVVHGTKAFLGHLKTRPAANLVNISSVYGLWGLATQAAYNASKFAVRGFTEALMQELKGTGVVASVVYPGGVRTNLVKNSGSHLFDTDAVKKEKFVSKFNSAAMTTPEKAARIIISGIKSDRRRIRVGPDAVLFDIVQRIFPTGYQRLAPYVIRKMGL
ncbi:MAG: SDR family oxidoreductase [Spirochaetes bacterium]|nr:SDR family oxidoreductase [Spirochaetota bacterium]